MYLPPCGPGETRIGISFPVPPPWADEISEARIRYGDEFGQMIPSHITIVGPTAINQAELNEISVHLDNVCDQIAPFTVELDGTGTFRPVNPVVFLNITTGYDELLALQKAVCTGPLECPLRFAYHPHVTLAHGVPEPQLDLAMGEFAGLKARFPAEALWLYRHEADGVWRKYCKFELRGK